MRTMSDLVDILPWKLGRQKRPEATWPLDEDFAASDGNDHDHDHDHDNEYDGDHEHVH